jgi:hypothetical protein
MALYEIGGVVLASEMPLPELPLARRDRAGIAFERLPDGAPDEEPGHWSRRWTLDDGEGTWALFARDARGWLVRFPALVEFRVAPDARRITCRSLPGTPEVTLRHLLLDQVLPLAMSRLGRFGLHASGVVIDGRAYGIVAPSGSGKSTLAAWLAREGAQLLSDDCLVIEESRGRWLAHPWYPGVRLWPGNAGQVSADPGSPVAHYTTKVRVGEAGGLAFHREAAPLAGLFILSEDGERVSARRMTPRDALVALVEASYLLEQEEPAALQAQFDFVGRVADAVPCHVLCYPYRYDVLPRVRELMIDPCKTVTPA